MQRLLSLICVHLFTSLSDSMDSSGRVVSSNRRRRRRRNTRGGGSGASGTEDTDNSVSQAPEVPLNGIDETIESSGRGTGSGSSTAGGEARINSAWKDGKEITCPILNVKYFGQL